MRVQAVDCRLQAAGCKLQAATVQTATVQAAAVQVAVRYGFRVCGGAGATGGGAQGVRAGNSSRHKFGETPSRTRRTERHGEGWERKSRWSECG